MSAELALHCRTRLQLSIIGAQCAIIACPSEMNRLTVVRPTSRQALRLGPVTRLHAPRRPIPPTSSAPLDSHMSTYGPETGRAYHALYCSTPKGTDRLPLPGSPAGPVGLIRDTPAAASLMPRYGDAGLRACRSDRLSARSTRSHAPRARLASLGLAPGNQIKQEEHSVRCRSDSPAVVCPGMGLGRSRMLAFRDEGEGNA